MLNPEAPADEGWMDSFGGSPAVIPAGWDYNPAWGYTFGLKVAARCALNYTRVVVELDAMHAGHDWAVQLCRAANATRATLACRLPMDADDHVRALALEGIA